MISDFLHEGRQNAVTLSTLQSLTGLDGRSIRLAIRRERLAGVPIISDNAHGYFLPGSVADLDYFARSMQHRAQEIVRIAEAAERAAAEARGQMTVGGW